MSKKNTMSVAELIAQLEAEKAKNAELEAKVAARKTSGPGLSGSGNLTCHKGSRSEWNGKGVEIRGVTLTGTFKPAKSGNTNLHFRLDKKNLQSAEFYLDGVRVDPFTGEPVQESTETAEG